ncbi:hypothetical protein BDR26DRAFT_917514 [Obelidium mucronatum]|nr:hypothetical protein BDR26DRAFT_917514 [Obelidium mucronatum]
MTALTEDEQRLAAETAKLMRSRFSFVRNTTATATTPAAAQTKTQEKQQQEEEDSEMMEMDIDLNASLDVIPDESIMNTDDDAQVPCPIPNQPQQQHQQQPKSNLEEYIERAHKADIKKSVFESQNKKMQMKGRFNSYRCVLKVDPMLLLDFDASYSLIHLSSTLKTALFDACLAVISKTLGGSQRVFSEDLQLVLRAAYLPSGIPELIVSDWKRQMFEKREMWQLHENQPTMMVLCGTVSKVYPPAYSIFQVRFCCNNTNCRDKNTMSITAKTTKDGPKFEGIKRSSSGTLIQASMEFLMNQINTDCMHCEFGMMESLQDRCFIRSQKIKVEAFGACRSSDSCFSNTVTVLLRDELVNTCQLGDQIEVIGSARRTGIRQHVSFQAAVKEFDYSVVFKANNARKLIWSPPLNVTWKHDPHFRRIGVSGFNSDVMPKSIQALLTENLSSFTFTQRLVDSFCADHVPVNMWRKLRLSLLLSLVSTPPTAESSNYNQNAKFPTMDGDHGVIRRAINVLLVTDDYTPMQQRLVNYAGSFRRFSRWGSDFGFQLKGLNYVGKDGGLES